MQVVNDEDSGQFNDSVVFHHPLKFTDRTVASLKGNIQQTALGIYEEIKLSNLLSTKQGQMIQLVSLDSASLNTFVTRQAIEVLEKYATQQIAFVLIIGSHESGKSYFCDKILNLSEVKGNNFSKNKQKGLAMWSSPFQKEGLNIFLVELNGCEIDSQEFKILSTYVLLMCSAIVIINPINQSKTNSIIEKIDNVFATILDEMTESEIEKLQPDQKPKMNKTIFMPKIIYNLVRNDKSKSDRLSVLSNHHQQYLPNALEKNYKGPDQDLVHTSFLDTKCVNEQYIRKVRDIFKEIYTDIEEKKYNQLVFNGKITEKVLKHIQMSVNNNNTINVQNIYKDIVEDLYLTAYNYCILIYHQDLQKYFDDQQPKDIDQLIGTFERASGDVLQRFNQFTLDQELHKAYQQKLVKHIDQKELMLMDINKQKTQIEIKKHFSQNQSYDINQFKENTRSLEIEKRHLTHDKAEFVGECVIDFFQKLSFSNNTHYKAMKQIQKIENEIANLKKVLQKQKHQNASKREQQSAINETWSNLKKKEQTVIQRIKSLQNLLNKSNQQDNTNEQKLKQQINRLQKRVVQNDSIIKELQQNKQKESSSVTDIQNRISQVKKKIIVQQTLLRQLHSKEDANTKDPLIKSGKQTVNKKEKKPTENIKV